jgi:hypothetical protein
VRARRSLFFEARRVVLIIIITLAAERLNEY